MHNFKRTILATLALALCVVLAYEIYTAPYFYGTAYYYQDAGVRGELSGQLDTLVCGSSHAFHAFIPEQMDAALGTSSYNLACAMQTMEGRYYLLQKELDRNPVKTVIMELSYNALTRNRETEGPEGDLYEMGRLTNPLERIEYLFRAYSVSEYGKLFYDTMDRSTTAWQKLFKGEMGLESKRGYLGLDAEDQSIQQSEWPNILHSGHLNLENYEPNVEIYERCMELCRSRGVKVVLVTTPMSECAIIKREGLETIRQRYAAYAQEYGCEFYDFNLIRTRTTDYPDQTAFYDESHLSKEGSATFTAAYCDLLQRVEAGENVSELFYADYNELETALTERFR